MEVRPPVVGSGPGTVSARVVRALRALGTTDRPPIVLAYHPVANTNPFQSLLYGACWEAGIAPVGVVGADDIEELTELARLGHPLALHLHWLNKPMHGATTAEAAAAGGRAFIALLDSFKAAGGRLVWTVHNILPHAARFEAEEAWFRGAVAERADVIHVMAAGTADLVAPYFRLPADRLLHVPHPSYVGAYPDSIDRGQARFDLELMPDELVFLVAGAIQPYKGIEDLLDAWDAMPLDGVPRRLLIAGGPAHGPEVDRLVERAALHPTVLIHPRMVESDRMQVYLRAADVAVLPYRRSLNSGALLLALSFGLPVIVPAGGGLAEVADGRAARTFVPGDRGSLLGALAGAASLATADSRAAARAAAEAVAPRQIAHRFASELRARLDRMDGSPA